MLVWLRLICRLLCDIPADDVPGLVALAQQEKVDFVVVGPEVPLSLGLVDALMKAGIPAATALLCEALDMLEQLGKIKVTNDTLSDAMQALGSNLLQLIGVTPKKLDEILSKQAYPAQSAMQAKNTAQNAANPTPAPTRQGPQPLIGAPA